MVAEQCELPAEELSSGRTADDLPVDAHMTMALCAPRLSFISHGMPERGDANCLNHQGSFMAAIAVQPVFRLLGAKDLGRSDDYTTEMMPSVNVYMLDGQLAWRQQVWADGLKPILLEILGPPALEDRAPSATGGPRAKAVQSPQPAAKP